MLNAGTRIRRAIKRVRQRFGGAHDSGGVPARYSAKPIVVRRNPEMVSPDSGTTQGNHSAMPQGAKQPVKIVFGTNGPVQYLEVKDPDGTIS